MFKQIVLLVAVLLTLASCDVIVPYDLVEEAEQQLQELITVMRRRILVADDDIQDLYNDFRSYARDERYDANLDIQQEDQLIESQIVQFKALAQSANKDVTSCTINREDLIKQLATDYSNQLTVCIDEVLAKGASVTKDAKYYVDIIMNKVHNIENQFKNCKGDLICILPLVTQIELYKVDLAQEIRLEISDVDDHLATLKLSSKYCAEINLSSYIAEANAILQNIISCVNAILD